MFCSFWDKRRSIPNPIQWRTNPRTVLAIQSHSPTKSSDLTFPLLRTKQQYIELPHEYRGKAATANRLRFPSFNPACSTARIHDQFRRVGAVRNSAGLYGM